MRLCADASIGDTRNPLSSGSRRGLLFVEIEFHTIEWDQVIVIRDGMVTESGPYETLLKFGRAFANIYEVDTEI